MSAESTFEIDVASGAALDALGQMAGAGPRLPGEPDASYRQHARDALRRRAEASPDAFRRAADEVADLLRRGADHQANIKRLTDQRNEHVFKMQDVRDHLARAGFPVDEGAWPTDQLRALIADRAALLAADDPMTAELIAILGGACLPSEIVGRVRDLKFDLDGAKGRIRSHHDLIAKLHAALNAAGVGLPDGTLLERVGDISRRLEAVTLDRDSLVGKLDAMRGERDAARSAIREMENNNLARVREVSALRKEVDALRAPKVAAVEWDGFSLIINGKTAASVGESLARPGVWLVSRFGSPGGEATSEPSARKLAELLAGHDPGGVWRVNGDIVSPDTVRLVCPSVAVTWGES